MTKKLRRIASDEEPTIARRKWRDVTRADLDTALAIVRYQHDPEVARNLIEYFYERMEDGDPYDTEILHEFLKHAFSKIIAEGWTADQAFGLKLRRGRYQREDTTERDVQAAAYVIALIRSGKKYSEAIGDAANLLFPDGEGDRTVEKAYLYYRDIISLLIGAEFDLLLPDGAAVIKRDMKD